MSTILKYRTLISKVADFFKTGKYLTRIGFVLSTMFLCSCAIFPINSHHTARTVGQDNWEFEVGTATNFDSNVVDVSNLLSAYMSATKGLSQDFDLRFSLGVQGWQAVGLQLSSKYAFLNNSGQGLSFALAGGVDTAVHYQGVILSSIHLGPILSYRVGFVEPYIALFYRPNMIKSFIGISSNKVFEDKLLQAVNQHGFINHTINPVLGCSFWSNQSLALNLYVSVIYSLGSISIADVTTTGGLGVIWGI